MESISIPRNIRQDVGPTDLCGANGIPNSSQVSHKIVWFIRQCSELGGPAVMKLVGYVRHASLFWDPLKPICKGSENQGGASEAEW